jgi:hypothetical protein
LLFHRIGNQKSRGYPLLLKNLFVNLNSLQGADASLAFRLDVDTIIIADRNQALAVISEENDVLELSFDPGRAVLMVGKFPWCDW